MILLSNVTDGERLFVGIEIGALLLSTDFGESFRNLHIDTNVQESDVHRILLHPERDLTTPPGQEALVLDAPDSLPNPELRRCLPRT